MSNKITQWETHPEDTDVVFVEVSIPGLHEQCFDGIAYLAAYLLDDDLDIGLSQHGSLVEAHLPATASSSDKAKLRRFLRNVGVMDYYSASVTKSDRDTANGVVNTRIVNAPDGASFHRWNPNSLASTELKHQSGTRQYRHTAVPQGTYCYWIMDTATPYQSGWVRIET